MLEILGITAAVGIGITVWLVNKIARERNNPYAFTQYFDKSITKIQMFEIESTEPISPENPKVVKAIITPRGYAQYGPQGLYFGGHLYNVPYEDLILSRQMIPSLFFIRVGKIGIIPIASYIFPFEIHKSERTKLKVNAPEIFFPARTNLMTKNEIEKISMEIEKPREVEANVNLALILPSHEKLEYMTDSNISSFYTRIANNVKKSLDSFEWIVQTASTFGVVGILAIIILSLALITASDIVINGLKIAGGGS